MCSRFLKHDTRHSTAGSTGSSERGFDGCWRATARTLDLALRITVHHADGVPRDDRRSPACCSSSSRRASSRSRTPASSSASSEAAQDISFAEMTPQQRAARRRSSPPTRTSPPSASAIGAGGGQTRQQRPHVHRAEAVRRAPARRRSQIIDAAAAASWPRSRARRCSCRPAQDINVGGRLSRTQYQYTLQDADLDELNEWAPKLLAQAADAAAADATSPPTSRPAAPTADADHRPRRGRPLRHPAAADRRHALRRLRPAPGHAVLHPGQQLPRDAGSAAGAAGRPVDCSTSSTSSRR